MSSSNKIKAILKKAKANKRLSSEEATLLFKATGEDIFRIIEAANQRREEMVGDQVTYVVNYNLNLTNICLNECKFCGFSCSRTAAKAYLLSKKEIKERILEAIDYDVSEVCLVSGLHPEFGLEKYAQVIELIKELDSKIHIHGITPEELRHALGRRNNHDFKDGYEYLKEAGLDSIPGTAAEILVSRVREEICPDKIDTDGWIEAIKAAAKVGFKSTATIMYGHIERIEERVKHLKIIRDIQDETGVFTEFIPLSFTLYNTLLYEEGIVNLDPTGREDLLMIAISRLFLDNILYIQASWVKYGVKLAQLMLNAGANDLGGTLFYENITKEAGGKNGEVITPEQMHQIITDLDREPVERNTIYGNDDSARNTGE